MLDVVIAGAGGFGREVYQWIKDSLSPSEYRIKGFLSDRKVDLEGYGVQENIIGDPLSYSIQENERFIVAIGDIAARKLVVEKMRERDAQFLTLIHPTAVVARSASIGRGSIICPLVVISDHVVLGNFVVMNFHSSCGHDTTVGEYATFSPHSTANGFVSIEEGVFLGTHATVMANRRVGGGAKISANSVATDDVPARTVVFGVPPFAKRMLLPNGDS